MKTFHKTTLPNGLRILSSPIATDSITLLVLVGAGSRYETKDINGISHFIEHMFFKGAKKYKNTKEVSEKIDGVGGEFNAFTGKEYAGYYVKLSKDQMEVAFDVVSDMLIHPAFLTEEINKERGVIMEEYNMYQDTPMYQIGWDFEKLIFGEHQPMGWDQVGTKELINSVTSEQFKSYHKELYQPDNCVISVAGNIHHKEIVDLTAEYFRFPDGKKTREWADFKGYSTESKVISQTKKTEQAHVVVGFPAFHSSHPLFYAQKLLAIILGGNMSSRMFLNVREAKGLCYYINSSTDDYHDCAVLSTSAGVTVRRVEEAIREIIGQYRNLNKNFDVSEEELQKSKNYAIGKLVISLEDSEKVAHMLGKKEILGENVKTLEDIKEEIGNITLKDVEEVSSSLLLEKEMRLAYIGPDADNQKLSSLLSYSL